MDFEKNKLEQKVRELETQLQVSKTDTNELSMSYRELVNEKNMLMQQLGHFEKESFEIQARVKRGLDAERESEQKQRTVDEIRDREREL